MNCVQEQQSPEERNAALTNPTSALLLSRLRPIDMLQLPEEAVTATV